MVLKTLVLVVLICASLTLAFNCRESVTTYTNGPSTVCSGDLIFEDNFDTLNLETWTHATSEVVVHFSDYVTDRNNSYTQDGVLFIKPTPNADYGVNSERKKPVNSARISTKNSFGFKYGRLEVRAKLPGSDWTQAAIWLIAKDLVYGKWPRSGEIDLMEAVGNRKFYENGVNIGSERIGNTLHFGPNDKNDPWRLAHKSTNSKPGEGFDTAFHKYQMEWTPEAITISLDDEVLLTVNADEGFWKFGKFDKIRPPLQNLWENATLMAPFDQEFFVILNVAVGGSYFYSDQAINENGKKPWRNWEKNAVDKFWQGRDQWLPTWEGDSSALQVDYVRVWAL